MARSLATRIAEGVARLAGRAGTTKLESQIMMGTTTMSCLPSPVITIFMGGMVTIPSHGWFMALF